MCPPRCVFLLSTTHVHKIFHPSARIGDFGAPRARTPAAPSRTNRLTSFRFLPTPPGFLPRQLRRRRRRRRALHQGAYLHPHSYPARGSIRANRPASARSPSPEPRDTRKTRHFAFSEGALTTSLTSSRPILHAQGPLRTLSARTFDALLNDTSPRENEVRVLDRSIAPNRPRAPRPRAPAPPWHPPRPLKATLSVFKFDTRPPPATRKRRSANFPRYFEFYGYGR